MKLRLHIFTLLFITFSVFGQTPKLEVKVSKTKLGLNQRLQVIFSINTQGADNFQPPKFENFKAFGPNQSVGSHSTYINGKVTQFFQMSYSYVVEPKQKGILTIEPASIVVKGKRIYSEPIKITVTDAIKIPKNPNDPNYIAQENAHLVTYISNRNPYVGEAVLVEYRIYLKNLGLSQLGDYDKPKYEGFWSQKIDDNSNWKRAKYKGEDYEYAVLEKAVLIPTKSGKLYIDEMTRDGIIDIPVKRRDLFGNIITVLGSRVRKTFSTPKQVVNVQALPVKNQPKNFTGAVGDFDYSVTLSKEELKANESSQIRVKVTGNGNLKSFKLPKVVTPSELEVYAPERKEKSAVTTSGLRGYLSETYTIVPQYKGKYKIPNTSFSYFNPKDKKYHTINSEELIVNVLEGKELPKEVVNPVIKQEVKSAGNAFRYIQTTSKFKPKNREFFFNSLWFYVLLILPLVVIPIVIFIDRKNRIRKGDVQGLKLRTANRLAKKYLSEAKKNLGKKQEFYESLERALHNYLKAKLAVETSDISREKITELLEKKNVNTKTISEFINLLKNCDFARYTPITDVEMKSEYEKTKTILTELDKQL